MPDAFSPAPSELHDITIWNLDNAANFLCCLLTETKLFIKIVEQGLCFQSKWTEQGFVVLNLLFLEDYMCVFYRMHINESDQRCGSNEFKFLTLVFRHSLLC